MQSGPPKSPLEGPPFLSLGTLLGMEHSGYRPPTSGSTLMGVQGLTALIAVEGLMAALGMGGGGKGNGLISWKGGERPTKNQTISFHRSLVKLVTMIQSLW